MNQYLIPICRVLVVALLITGIFSCNSPEPISDNEALAFARHIEQAFKEHDENGLNRLLDMDELADRIANKAGVRFDPKTRSNIKAGLDDLHYGTKLLAYKNAGYQLVKHYIKKKKHHLLFRLHSEDGLNYHDYELVSTRGK